MKTYEFSQKALTELKWHAKIGKTKKIFKF